MLNFRSKQGSFLQACRGTSRESDAAWGEKAVKDALQRVLRHVLALNYTIITHSSEIGFITIW
ncbi:unknown protein [Paenibacillus amylolyticus]|uniref:Uncharacterized protein n=1 Tax=Paenibacillus amylolyticus TaxID=1451 RepID=A0A100VRF9_PAEAM|nr:unknown protein [Paenibacillus amylolyticus]